MRSRAEGAVEGFLAILIYLTFFFVFGGCRPDRRPQRVIRNSPVVVVEITEMKEFGEENYIYLLSGESCASAEGEVRTALHAVLFTGRRIKPGLGGCILLVREKQPRQNIKYTGMDGVIWASQEFSIGQNENQRMVARAVMKKTYESLPKPAGGNFDLQVSVLLPPEIDFSKIESARGVIFCSGLVTNIAVKKLSFEGLNHQSLLEWSELAVNSFADVITCSRIVVRALIGGKIYSFDQDIKVRNSFIPVEGKVSVLNGSKPYVLRMDRAAGDEIEDSELTLTSSSSDGGASRLDSARTQSSLPASSSLLPNASRLQRAESISEMFGGRPPARVLQSRCPPDRPWLELNTEVGARCRSCSIAAPIFNSVLQRCLQNP